MKSALTVGWFFLVDFEVLIMCLHLIEEVLVQLSLQIAGQERLELLAVSQEVKMENSRFSSEVNRLLCLKLNCVDLHQRMGKKPGKEALKVISVNGRGTTVLQKTRRL